MCSHVRVHTDCCAVVVTSSLPATRVGRLRVTVLVHCVSSPGRSTCQVVARHLMGKVYTGTFVQVSMLIVGCLVTAVHG